MRPEHTTATSVGCASTAGRTCTSSWPCNLDGTETGEQDPLCSHTQGLRPDEDPVQLTLGGAPHVPDDIGRVTRPVRGPEPRLGEPPAAARALRLIEVTRHHLDAGPRCAEEGSRRDQSWGGGGG